jgi:hypothetical protein
MAGFLPINSVPGVSGGAGSDVPVQDEGIQVVASPTALDFVGDGVTVSDTAGVATITIPGAAGSNSFSTINAPAGTDPVAFGSDTLNLAGTADQLTITGDSGTKTLTFALPQDIAVTSAVAFGSIDVSGLVSAQSYELDNDAGTFQVTLQAPALLAADYTLTFPVDDGGAGEILTTNGAGVLSWTAVGTTETASNVGTGVGVFQAKVANDLQFHSLAPVANKGIVITDAGNEITFALDITDLTSAVGADQLTDEIAVYNQNDTTTRKITLGELQSLIDTNTQLSQEQVEDFVGGMLGGTETGILVTYDDIGGMIDFVVDHDTANNFVTNEHIDHTSVSMITGATSGLSGGGDISSNRTLLVAPHLATTKATPVDGDSFLIADSENSDVLRKMTLDNLPVVAVAAANEADIADLRTLTNTVDGAVHMGAYTGTFLTSNLTIKQNIQEIETYIDDGTITIATASQPNIDHDSLLNFVANEHTDWGSTSRAFSTSGTLASGNASITGNAIVTSNLTVDTNTFFVDSVNNRVGFGTVTPAMQLDITGSIQLTKTTDTNLFGVIYKDGLTFIHDYENISDASSGKNLFIGEGSGNFTLTSPVDSYRASNLLGIGRNTLASVTTGYDSVGIGYNSLNALTEGFQCFAIGIGSMALLTTGNSNIGLGNGTLSKATSASSSVAIGRNSLFQNLTGARNVAIGTSALNQTLGASNVAIGTSAGLGVTGSNFSFNVLIGDNVGSKLTTGSSNVMLGRATATEVNSGSFNTIIGTLAGATLTTGTLNILLGYNAQTTTPTSSNELNIGNTIYGNVSTQNVGIGIVPTVRFHVSKSGGDGNDLTVSNENANLEVIKIRAKLTADTNYHSANISVLRDGDGNGVFTVGTSLAGTITEAFRIDSDRNCQVGTAALATTATNGFFYIPGSAGTPTGVPTAKTGLVPMHYDTTNNEFYIYNGGWKKGTTFS